MILQRGIHSAHSPGQPEVSPSCRAEVTLRAPWGPGLAPRNFQKSWKSKIPSTCFSEGVWPWDPQKPYFPFSYPIDQKEHF